VKTLAQELNLTAETAARRLLGATLSRTIDGRVMSGRVVETEAYDQTDVASHSYRGQTERTKVMFGPAGFLYVYFTYGMHYCCNVVVGQEGYGAAVLIRALEPLSGQEQMRQNRRDRPDLTNGPAKLCQALEITKINNGADLSQGEIRLELQPPVPAEAVVQTTRIGISQAKEVPWRFYLRDNPFVSKPV
jgi:DNA-3-methyladenine glycosylase